MARLGWHGRTLHRGGGRCARRGGWRGEGGRGGGDGRGAVRARGSRGRGNSRARPDGRPRAGARCGGRGRRSDQARPSDARLVYTVSRRSARRCHHRRCNEEQGRTRSAHHECDRSNRPPAGLAIPNAPCASSRCQAGARWPWSLVSEGGLEPPRDILPPAPQAGASANSATPTWGLATIPAARCAATGTSARSRT